MDPSANLAEQLSLAKEIIRRVDFDKPIDEHDCVRLAELVESLDGWITRGGFLPARWRK